MTKQILIPSVLLIASGCTTASGDFSLIELEGAEAAAKESVGFPGGDEGGEGLNINAIVDPVLEAFEKSDLVEGLLEMSYAMPELPGWGLAADAPCSTSPDFNDDLVVLDSAGSSALRHRWGWEIPVTDCEIGGETFNGVMRYSYEELAREPVLGGERSVWQVAGNAAIANAEGHSSLRFELDLASSRTHVYAVGSEFGPEQFLSSDYRATLVDLETMSISEVKSDSMSRHSDDSGAVAGSNGGVIAHQFTYARSPGEISLEDGDLSRVTIGTEGLLSRPGEAWPYSGTISGVIRDLGPTRVEVRFSDRTPIDGTVEVAIPGGWILHTLSMD